MSILICTSTSASDSSGLIAIKLNTLWRIKSGTGYGVTVDAVERDKSQAAAALYYLPASAADSNGTTLSGTGPLFRLHRKSGTGGADLVAITDFAQGYDAGSTLGFRWMEATVLPGLAPILRASTIQAGGSAESTSLVASSDGMHRGEALPGYEVTGRLGYAYPRFASSEMLLAVSGGEITVKSNANAGGAVWEWWWMDKQFINDYDHGRQLSTALYTEDGKALQEAGDQYGAPNIPIFARHPCPTLYVRNIGESKQSSRAIPLEWSPARASGGKDNAVIYANAKIGKELTLNWKGPDGVDRSWPVALYESVYEGPPFTVATVEAPTAYLNAEFTTYYKYEPAHDVLAPILAYHTNVNLSAGVAYGVVMASGSGPNAVGMGVYINDPNAGIVLYDNSGPSNGKFGSSFSKWGVVYRSTVTPTWRFRTWIVTDRVANIQKVFRQLHAWGVTSRDLKAE